MTGDRVQRSLPYFSPIPIWVLEQLSGRGKQSHLCIYAWLAHHADRDSDKCFVLYRTLAKESGYSERFVSKVCNELAEWGMLGITPRFGDNGGQRANEFTVMVYPPDARERTPLLRDDTPLPPRESTPPPLYDDTHNKNQKNKNQKNKNGSVPFDRFWSKWPRSEKAKSPEIWDSLPAYEQTAIIKALPRWMKQAKREQGDDFPKFVPHASTWLNQRRWEDDLEKVAPARPKTELGAMPVKGLD